MNVLIVAKTRMNTGLCVGGLGLDNDRSVRLLPLLGHNQPNETAFAVGQIWDLDFNIVEGTVAPHTEDVRVTKSVFVRSLKNISTFLSKRVRIFPANPQSLFDGMLRLTGSGSAYISQRTGVPSYSTCFWRPDRPVKKLEGQKIRYHIRHSARNFEVTYVGTEPAIDEIPPNTLVRLSLARWWRPEDVDVEERCYLQLSGWYID